MNESTAVSKKFFAMSFAKKDNGDYHDHDRVDVIPATYRAGTVYPSIDHVENHQKIYLITVYYFNSLGKAMIPGMWKKNPNTFEFEYFAYDELK